MFRATLNTSIFQNITQLVRILPPLPTWVGTKPGHAKPQCFDDSRDSKNDSIWGARREIQRRRRHAPSCMGATELQRNCPEMRKTLGKPLVLQHGLQKVNGEDRNRTFGCFLNVSREFDRCLYDSFDLSIVGNRCKSSTAT